MRTMFGGDIAEVTGGFDTRADLRCADGKQPSHDFGARWPRRKSRASADG